MYQSSIVAALVMFSVTLGALRAQNTRPPPAEPEYSNIFYVVDSNGALLPLEHNTSTTFHSKRKPLPGNASVNTLVEFEPGHSPVRLTAHALRFVVRGRTSIDLSTRFELRSVKTSKEHRGFEIVYDHGLLMGSSASSTLDNNTVPLRFEDYGLNSYRITSHHSLAAGEYVFSLRGMISDLYCFRVAE